MKFLTLSSWSALKCFSTFLRSGLYVFCWHIVWKGLWFSVFWTSRGFDTLILYVRSIGFVLYLLRRLVQVDMALFLSWTLGKSLVFVNFQGSTNSLQYLLIELYSTYVSHGVINVKSCISFREAMPIFWFLLLKIIYYLT